MTISLFTPYAASFWAVYALLVMVFVQALVAAVAHRAQKSYVPGIVDEKLGPESFVFRSNRAFMNSIENVPFMIGLVLLAVMSGFDAWWLALLSWIYVLGRLAHMVTYYLVATRKNPSLRSYFFIVCVLVQLVLLVMLGVSWL
nr:MAPEG family protein [uncultured Cohaesibacter sp.]